MNKPFKTLEERIHRLERAHRRHQFRRAVKIGLAVATALLLLWLLRDAIHAWALLKTQLQTGANVIGNLQQSVSSLQNHVSTLTNSVSHLTVKINGNVINGQAVPAPVQTTQSTLQLPSAPSMGLLGGVLGMLARLLPVLA